MLLRWLTVAAVLLGLSPAWADPAYGVVQRIQAPHGTLQILQDARLTRELEIQMWEGCVDPASILGGDDPTAKLFSKAPLAPAKLRQLDSNGSVVSEMAVDDLSPIARIEKQTLGDPRDPFYLLRTNTDTACFGSYAGQPVKVYFFQDDRFSPVFATGSHGKRVPVSLFDSLKSGWRIVRNKPNDIVVDELYCRPDFDAEKRRHDGSAQFKLIFHTYRFHNGIWHYAVKETPGFWESDNEFPAHRKFP